MKNQKTFIKSFIPAVILLAVLVSCGQTKKDENSNLVIVAGKIINPNKDSVWIRVEPQVGRDYTSYGDKLDENGSFNIRFETGKPMPVTFYDGNETTQMFVNPGDSVYLTLNTEEFDETVKYSGKGAEKNNFLAQKYLKFDDNPQYNFWSLIDSLSPEEYKAVVDKKKTDWEKMLNDFTLQHKVSPEFINFEKTEMAFAKAYEIYLFINKKRDYSIGYDTVNIPAGFYKDFASLTGYKNPCKMSKQYNIYYNFYYPSYLAAVNSDVLKDKTGEERDSLLLSIYMANLDGFERERAVANYFHGKVKRFDVDFFEKNKALFDKNVKDADLKKYVYDEYDKVKKQLALPMPEGAHLVNLERKEYSGFTFKDLVDKYKGKVIYLDFWASWCGPCKAEMPYSLEMQDYFKGKDVAFVYISSDRDSVAWKQMIKVLQITGDHYRANKKFRKEYDKLYNVRYIPRYVIIDKNGKTVDDKAKRPSNPEVRKDIEDLLK